MQRVGLGGRIMSVVDHVARVAGLTKLKLTVLKSNTAAVRFYKEKLGYVSAKAGCGGALLTGLGGRKGSQRGSYVRGGFEVEKLGEGEDRDGDEIKSGLIFVCVASPVQMHAGMARTTRARRSGASPTRTMRYCLRSCRTDMKTAGAPYSVSEGCRGS